MNYYLYVFIVSIRNLTDSLSSGLQKLCYARQIIFTSHAIVDFITNLYHLNIYAFLKKLCQTVFGVIIQSITLLVNFHAFPCLRCMLSLRVSPEIRIVEVNAYFHAIFCCTPAQFDCCWQIIIASAIAIAVLIIRIIPHSQTNVIHTCF